MIELQLLRFLPSAAEGEAEQSAPPLCYNRVVRKDTLVEDMDGRVRKLEADSQQMMADIETLDKRVANHGAELDELKIKSATMDTVLTRIDATVAKIDGRMDAQQMKPAQRWDDLVKQVITLVVAAVVGAILLRLGLQ